MAVARSEMVARWHAAVNAWSPGLLLAQPMRDRPGQRRRGGARSRRVPARQVQREAAERSAGEALQLLAATRPIPAALESAGIDSTPVLELLSELGGIALRLSSWAAHGQKWLGPSSESASVERLQDLVRAVGLLLERLETRRELLQLIAATPRRTAKQAIVEALERAAPEGIATLAQIAQRTGYAVDTVKEHSRTLQKAGKIHHRGYPPRWHFGPRPQ